MNMVRNLDDAEQTLTEALAQRGITVARAERRAKPGNTRLFTNTQEVYHLKFTQTPFRPDSEKTGPARDLHLKLQYAMNTFEYRSDAFLEAEERGTMVGLDEDLLLHLLELATQGWSTYVVTVLGRGITLWLEAGDFYQFVMRYDTFMKFPRSGVPVCYVPTGYFLTWNAPRIFYPSLES